MFSLSPPKKYLHIVIIVLLSTFFSFNFGCQQHRLPLAPVDAKSLPLFIDDDDRTSLLDSVKVHRSYLAELPEDYKLQINQKSYPLSWLQESMAEFEEILRSTAQGIELHSDLLAKFDVYQAAGRKGKPYGEMLVTGYFEPVFSGSLEPTSLFRYPLYKRPSSLIDLKNKETGSIQTGRISHNGKFVSYWTRAEIENGRHLAGEELVYLSDPFEVFLVHVQGSAKIQLPGGTTRSVRYAGNNGHQYNSIGKLLVDEGKLSLAEASLPAIRAYFNAHPDEQQRILHHNPRFIFFQWGDTSPPRGNLGKPLTPGRSVAIDQSVLPKELVGWLTTSRPVVDSDGEILTHVQTHRFVLPQDTGNAIKGAGRLDLFLGSGPYASAAAGSMREPGKLYFFIKKGYKPTQTP